ncbi:MarR family winged helix-turn-helix transcriptional regulator [Ammoniphilus sp. CFH 90114]|uniref:MarR family winged helix-turn-helix transcriptional regulator n=1 Tax=Ammoniphilus sp. CFH 90114 TaxID=2493665 RepID=UPI00100FCC11|nr:MarR family transcriptional regulator [Ammoniphilus sp. CFH 90114]RXT03623.1 MarR family transcriptional regulator [Ammoniphilus sp. CFH 90114]
MDYRDYSLDKSLGHKLAKSSRLLTNRLNQRFRENNLSITVEQWVIMVHLWENDGLTQNDLSSLTGKDQPSVSRLIDNMIKRDLVKRLPHPTDRRTNLIYLTPYGKEIQKALIAQVMTALAEASHGIDPKEMEICFSVLDRVIVNLSE